VRAEHSTARRVASRPMRDMAASIAELRWHKLTLLPGKPGRAKLYRCELCWRRMTADESKSVRCAEQGR
jgi:hypothetical protein